MAASSPKSDRATPRDPIDPELLKLSKPRTKVGWLLSLSVVVFCGYWMFTLRHDLRYSRAADTPTPIEPTALPAITSESFVEVELIPDRAQLARIWTGRDLGIHAAPALGHSGIWLITPASAFAGDPGYDNLYRGRVKRLGELPFFDELVDYYQRADQPMESIDPNAFIDHIRKTRKTELTTKLGDPMPIDASTSVELLWRRAQRAWVTVAPNEEFSNPQSWANALRSQAGLAIQGSVINETNETNGTDPERATKGLWTFEVEAPDGVEAISAKIRAAGLLVNQVSPVESVIQGVVGDIQLNDQQLRVKTLEIPLIELQAVKIPHRVIPQADDVALIAGETPDDFSILWLIYLFFLLIGGLFTWTFVRALRGSAPPTPAPSS